MTHEILAGNLISAFASIFLVLSCWVSDRKRAYLLQAGESGCLCLSSVFFRSWAGLSTVFLSTVRNLLTAYGKYTNRLMWIFTVLVVALGLAVNNRGLIGLLPIAATVQLTVCNYYLKEILPIKWSFFANTVMWGIYDFAILDIVSGITQVIACLVCLVSILRLLRNKDERADAGRQKI